MSTEHLITHRWPPTAGMRALVERVRARDCGCARRREAITRFLALHGYQAPKPPATESTDVSDDAAQD